MPILSDGEYEGDAWSTSKAVCLSVSSLRDAGLIEDGGSTGWETFSAIAADVSGFLSRPPRLISGGSLPRAEFLALRVVRHRAKHNAANTVPKTAENRTFGDIYI
jgi:hypothetical protein